MKFKKWQNREKTITLYNEDCLLIFEKLLKEGYQGKIDMIACDPPYKTTGRCRLGSCGGMFRKAINRSGKVFEHNDMEAEDWFKGCYDLLKDTGHCYIMCNHFNLIKFLNIGEKVGFKFIKSLIWKKDNKIMGAFYMSQFEYILFFRKGKGVQINNCGTTDVLEFPNKKIKLKNGENAHDTEKPVELMKILIENSSKENELVLDFTFGIGATAIACKETNRKFIGCEINKKYFDIAVKRLENTIIERTDNLTLF